MRPVWLLGGKNPADECPCELEQQEAAMLINQVLPNITRARVQSPCEYYKKEFKSKTHTHTHTLCSHETAQTGTVTENIDKLILMHLNPA